MPPLPSLINALCHDKSLRRDLYGSGQKSRHRRKNLRGGRRLQVAITTRRVSEDVNDINSIGVSFRLQNQP